MAAYLEAFIQDADGDALFIAKAMEDIAGAKGMTQIARETGLSSERLYKAMSVEKSPHFDTVLKVISALGLTLSASVKGAERAELVLLANLRFADVSNWKRPFEQAPGVDRPPPIPLLRHSSLFAWQRPFAWCKTRGPNALIRG